MPTHRSMPPNETRSDQVSESVNSGLPGDAVLAAFRAYFLRKEESGQVHAPPITLHLLGRDLGWIDTVVRLAIWAMIQYRDVAISTPRRGRLEVIHCDSDEPFCARLRISLARLTGQGLDNAVMESFWSSMQIELLNCKRWKTRLELANAIFDYIEIFYNRQRRHSSLDYRTPLEHELLSEKNLIPARDSSPRVETKQWGRSTSQLKWGQSQP